MDGFSFPQKSKESNLSTEQSIILPSSPVEDAEKVAEIISASITKGEYSSIEEKLGAYSTNGKVRDQFVFQSPSKTSQVIPISFAMIFTLLFLFLSTVFVRTLIYSDEFETLAIIGLSFSIAIIILNVYLTIISGKRVRFIDRYSKYCNVLRFRNIILMDDLSSQAKIDQPVVVKDLNDAVEMKLIPQGHFGIDELLFIMSDEVFHAYEQNQAAYDRYFRKLIDERTRMSERTPQMEFIMSQGQRYIEKIHESNTIIKDKAISTKLDQMEKLVSLIFYEVDINPNQTDNLGMFLNYYLPTTEKLLGAYIDLDEKQIKGKSLTKAKKDIGGALDTLSRSFEGILDRFYQEQEIDVASDIAAMEIMLKQDGLIESQG